MVIVILDEDANTRGLDICDLDITVLDQSYECIICLGEIPSDEYITSNHGLVVHPHGYHITCWMAYRKTNNKCPYCRGLLYDNVAEHVRNLAIVQPDDPYITEFLAYQEMMQLDNLIFIATMGNTFDINVINGYVSMELMTKIASLYITCKVLCSFLRRYICNPMALFLCVYVMFHICFDIINNYSMIIDATVSEAQYQQQIL